jgi:serine/threonine protein phosphatase PrpC
MRVEAALPIGDPNGMFRASGDSHPGLQRQENEDRFHVDPVRGIFLVVDGVGGHAAGEQAADTAVAMLRARLERETGPLDDRIREAITIANNEIHRRALLRPEWKGMGCVLTVAVVNNGHATVGHVGDTRLYKIRRGEIVKITRDHSPVGEREDANELSEAEAMRHPRRNEVYRDVGAEPHEPTDEEFIDIQHVAFESDAALLICSDGLTDTVPSATIARVIREYAGQPDEVVHGLIDAANDAGGKDNVTVVYVEGSRFSDSRANRVAPVPMPERVPVAIPNSTTEPAPEPAPSRRWVMALLTLLLLAVAGWSAWTLGVRWPFSVPTSWRGFSLLPAPDTIVVQPTGSIAAAMQRARAGTEVIVEPGEYRERLRLKSGVRVRSRVSRGASIRLPGGASENDAAILAADIDGAEVAGFKIVGDAATPLGVGLLARHAGVVISDLEISGAQLTAIEIGEGRTPTILATSVHDNPGAGLTIRAGATPRITHSQFARNGMSERAAGAIVMDAGARPYLRANVFHGILAESFAGLTQAERAEIKATNVFIATDDPGGRPAPRPGRGRQ